MPDAAIAWAELRIGAPTTVEAVTHICGSGGCHGTYYLTGPQPEVGKPRRLTVVAEMNYFELQYQDEWVAFSLGEAVADDKNPDGYDPERP